MLSAFRAGVPFLPFFFLAVVPTFTGNVMFCDFVRNPTNFNTVCNALHSLFSILFAVVFLTNCHALFLFYQGPKRASSGTSGSVIASRVLDCFDKFIVIELSCADFSSRFSVFIVPFGFAVSFGNSLCNPNTVFHHESSYRFSHNSFLLFQNMSGFVHRLNFSQRVK